MVSNRHPRPWGAFRIRLSKGDVPKGYGLAEDEVMLQNNLYTVIAAIEQSGWSSDEHPEGIPMLHLSIRKNDRKQVRLWRDLQRIKSEIAGSDCEAIELFPHEERVLDGANQYHLYCFPPGMFVPVGVFGGRNVADDEDVQGYWGDKELTETERKAIARGRQSPFEYGKDAGRREKGVLADWHVRGLPKVVETSGESE